MNELQWFASSHWLHLTHALAHSLWIGAVAAVALAAALARIPARRTDLRYGLAVLAMSLTALGVILTWAILEYDPKPTPGASESHATRAETLPGQQPSAAPQLVLPTPQAPAKPSVFRDRSGALVIDARSPWTAWASAAWALGAALMLVRAALALAGAGRLRRSALPTADEGIRNLVDGLASAMGLARRVGLAVCDRIGSPVVVGILWPTILVPASMLTGLPPELLRAILAHELAHVRRWDNLVNVAQLLIEALLFFNPAIWWVSRRIRAEREACCDWIAAELTQDSRAVARALVAHAEAAATAQAAMAFGSRERGGASLVERIGRLVVPGYRPPVRLTWQGLAVAFLVAMAALACVKKASDEAVGVAGRFLSAEQRIDKMAELKKEVDPYAGREFTEADDITISGRVRTADGGPLPGNLRCNIYVHRSSLGMSAGCSVAADGTFSDKVTCGELSFTVTSDGYAAAFAGPFTTGPGGQIKDIDILLTRGFVGRIRLLDPEGNPIPGVKLSGRYSTTNFHIVNLQTDAAGVATIDHCATPTMSLTAIAPGFKEDEREDVAPKPGEVFDWKLERAKPAQGVVVDAATGQPVAGAKLRLVHAQQGDSGNSYGVTGPIAATTDGQGQFALDTLREDTRYSYVIEAEGHRKEVLRNVGAGQENLRVVMRSPLYVQGKVLAAKDMQTTETKGLQLAYRQTLKVDNSSHVTLDEVKLNFVDGVAPFRIEGLWDGELKIEVGETRQKLEVTQPVEDLVIDLRPESQAAQPKSSKRDVVLRFEIPAGGPPPKGTMNVLYCPDASSEYATREHVPIQNGEAKVSAVVGSTVNCETDSSCAGYWFPSNHLKVEPGIVPQIVTIPATPAGAIAGRLLDFDGSPPQKELLVSVQAVKSAPGMENKSLMLHSIHASPATGEFFAAPLPLGGTYALVISDRWHYCESKPIRVDEDTPIKKVEMRFGKGVTVTGQAVDPDGHAIPGLEVSIDYKSPFNMNFGGQPVQTDADGRFAFDGVNPDLPGEYKLQIEPDKDYSPVGQPLKPDEKPILIRLERGLVVEGVVLDDATGRPVPDARVSTYVNFQTDSNRSVYTEITARAEAPTDAQGRFRFSNLRPGADYSFSVEDANRPPNTYGKPDIAKDLPPLDGPMKIRIVIPEWSHLRPAPEK